jgi:hypothetical protein
VVETGPTRDLVIGNFISIDPHPAANDLDIVRDFGSGVRLLRKPSGR